MDGTQSLKISGDETQHSLEKIKKRLANASASCLMESVLYKRSETLRKWNKRYFTLDPATGRMEYRLQHGDATPRGIIHFEPESTITLSPINFHGLKQYDGCCIYIGTPQKKEYFLCAETPTIAKAWVSTLRAAALVLKAHKEAVDSLSGSGHARLGTVSAVVAAANATAKEAMKEIHLSLKEARKQVPEFSNASLVDGSDVVKETLRVKDEELSLMARELRARDLTIKEMADRLAETADAAEAAASAAREMDIARKNAQIEVEHLKKEFTERLYMAAREVRASEGAASAAMKSRDDAIQEAQRWRVEFAKARDHVAMMEESARRALADADEKLRLAKAAELMASVAKDEALHLLKQWQDQAENHRKQAERYLILLGRGAHLQETPGVQEVRTDNTSEVSAMVKKMETTHVSAVDIVSSFPSEDSGNTEVRETLALNPPLSSPSDVPVASTHPSSGGVADEHAEKLDETWSMHGRDLIVEEAQVQVNGSESHSKVEPNTAFPDLKSEISTVADTSLKSVTEFQTLDSTSPGATVITGEHPRPGVEVNHEKPGDVVVDSPLA